MTRNLGLRVFSEGPPYSVTSYDKPGVPRTYLNPDLHGIGLNFIVLCNKEGACNVGMPLAPPLEPERCGRCLTFRLNKMHRTIIKHPSQQHFK